MRAEIVLLGKRLNMASQLRRRVLVVAIYTLLVGLMAALWHWTHWRGTGAYMFWAAMLLCRFFLGGYYSSGLVKPFNGKAPRQSEMPPPLLLLKLRIYQPVLTGDEALYRNDERELEQRDRAHYLAFQAIGVSVTLMAFLASMRILSPRLQGWMAMPADQLYYGCALGILILFLTLPQSILLWTEPDMEDPGDYPIVDALNEN